MLLHSARRIGALLTAFCHLRLLMASENYHHALSKKKDCVALEDSEKLLPIDTLGVVMIVHGEEFGDDSAFGG